jgi:DNA-binding NtrC family response regulator
MIGAAEQAAGERPDFAAAPRAEAGDAAAARAEVEDLKLLILAIWRELGAIERQKPPAAAAEVRPAALDFQREVRLFESDLIRCALIRTGGRQRRAARLLGIKAATLNAKIKRYRIDADAILNQAAALRLRNK